MKPVASPSVNPGTVWDHCRHVGYKLAKWLLFSVLFAVLPLLAVYAVQWAEDRPLALSMAISRGELLLVSTAIAAESLGELVTGSNRLKTLKMIAGSTTTALGLFMALMYAQFQGPGPRNVDKVSILSLWLFGGTILTAVFCRVLGEESGSPRE